MAEGPEATSSGPETTEVDLNRPETRELEHDGIAGAQKMEGGR